MDMEDDSRFDLLGPATWAPTRREKPSPMVSAASVIRHGKLGLTVGGASHVGGELTVLALVADENAKTVKLKLEPGLTLIGDQKLEQEVKQMRPDAKGRRPSPVTWRVRADQIGRHDITVTTDTGATQSRRVTIRGSSLPNQESARSKDRS